MIRDGKDRNDSGEMGSEEMRSEGMSSKGRRGPVCRERRRGMGDPVTSLLALALALACSVHAAKAGAAGGKEKGSGTVAATADSLHALRVLISSEVKPGNEVLQLKDARLSDSLLSHSTSRESFLKGLRDSAVSRPIRGPEEFRAYWDRIEKENGIAALKGQMAAHDVDKGRIPKAYLFDSSVVVYPGWIIVRRMHRR